MATLDSLTFTIRLPLISETTVTTPPTTKPSSISCDWNHTDGADKVEDSTLRLLLEYRYIHGLNQW